MLLTFKNVDLENLGRGHKAQHFRSDAVRCQISTTINVKAHFAPALNIFEIFRFELFDLENSGHDHKEKLDLCHSIANVRLYFDVFFRI